MTDSKEEKQNYLRDNILDKGYNPNDFIFFLKTKKGEDGADLSNWTMEDLKNIVADFTSMIGNSNNNKN